MGKMFFKRDRRLNKSPSPAKSSRVLPKSATNGWVVLFGLIVFVLSAFYVKKSDYSDHIVEGGIFCLSMTGLTHVILDLFWTRVTSRKSTGLDLTQRQWSIARTSVKLFGLFACVGFIALLYWLFPEYHGTFYNRYWQALEIVGPPFLTAAVPYFYIVDAVQIRPRDAYYEMGLLCLLQFEKVKYSELKPLLLGWLIKGFFFPLMFTYFLMNLERLVAFDFSSLQSFNDYFNFLFDSIFFIDVGIVSVGYLLSLRVCDSHLRWPEMTLMGWVVAIICYQPFWSLIGGQYIDYNSGQSWGSWLQLNSTPYVIWGCSILFLYSIYLWASVVFGIRFSNLTHRGIITSGPYAWTKHPAYISKNLAWWLTAIPFATSDSLAEMIRRCLLILFINIVYFVRAKTEEKNLSLDPEYQNYANWIEANGAIAKAKSFILDMAKVATSK